MTAIRVTGTWDGEYTYGPGHPDLVGLAACVADVEAQAVAATPCLHGCGPS